MRRHPLLHHKPPLLSSNNPNTSTFHPIPKQTSKMKYFTVSALLALASLGAAADFKLETWSGTDCKNGDHLTWSAPKHVGPGSCQFMANVKSLKVDSLLSHCTGKKGLRWSE